MSEIPAPTDVQPVTANDINEAVKRASTETEITPENKQRAEKVVAGATEFIREATDLGPDHVVWREGGLLRTSKEQFTNQVAKVMQVVLPPMRQAVESRGRVFFPEEDIDLTFQHIAAAGMLNLTRRPGGEERSLPSQLPGLSREAPQSYLQEVQVLSEMIPQMSIQAENLDELLNPGSLPGTGSRHQGFVNTFGDTLVQLEQLRTGS